jgi:hypothetical protein
MGLEPTDKLYFNSRRCRRGFAVGLYCRAEVRRGRTQNNREFGRSERQH